MPPWFVGSPASKVVQTKVVRSVGGWVGPVQLRRFAAGSDQQIAVISNTNAAPRSGQRGEENRATQQHQHRQLHEN